MQQLSRQQQYQVTKRDNNILYPLLTKYGKQNPFEITGVEAYNKIALIGDKKKPAFYLKSK